MATTWWIGASGQVRTASEAMERYRAQQAGWAHEDSLESDGCFAYDPSWMAWYEAGRVYSQAA